MHLHVCAFSVPVRLLCGAVSVAHTTAPAANASAPAAVAAQAISAKAGALANVSL